MNQLEQSEKLRQEIMPQMKFIPELQTDINYQFNISNYLIVFLMGLIIGLIL